MSSERLLQWTLGYSVRPNTGGFQNTSERIRAGRAAPNRKALAASNSGSGAGAVSGSLSRRIDARAGESTWSRLSTCVGAMNLATHILLRHTHTHSTDPATHTSACTHAHTQPLDCCQNLRHSYPSYRCFLSITLPASAFKNTLGQRVVELLNKSSKATEISRNSNISLRLIFINSQSMWICTLTLKYIWVLVFMGVISVLYLIRP